VWDDNTRRDVEDGVQLEDADEVRDVTLADGALSFEWTRTNFDGSTWTVPISVPAPEGAEDWWAELPAAGPAPYSAEYQVEETDGSLVVTGTTDAPDGTVFEVSLPNGDRFPVEVVDGLFDVTVPGGTGSGGAAAQVFYGGHVLGCSTGCGAHSASCCNAALIALTSRRKLTEGVVGRTRRAVTRGDQAPRNGVT
jgi:hypothetical protein